MSKGASVKLKILKDIDGKALDALRDRLRRDNRVVNVGVPAGPKEEDGTPLAKIAAIHEYGGTINMPARTQTIYRQVSADGSLKAGGRFVKRSRSNFASDHAVAAHKIRIPERPFLRVAIEKNKQAYIRLNRINLARIVRGDTDVPAALSQLGEMAKSHVQTEIRSGNFTPLAPATIKRKGSSRPLIDTGQLVQSIAWELGEKTND